MAARRAGTKTPAPEMFEATCPTCGMTAIVPAGVEQVRCGACGTVVRLGGAPAVAAAPSQAIPQAQEGDRAGAALAIGLAGPLLVGFAFAVGHHAIDQPEPDTGTGGVWYLAALLLACGVVFAQWPILGRGRVLPGALWGLFAAVPALWVGIVAGTSYDDGGFAWLILGLPLLGIYAIAILVAALVQANRSSSAGAKVVLVGGAGLSAGLGLAAAYMLMTLQDQAQEAREAHEAPAWGFLAVAAVLLVVASLRRRAAD